MRAFLKRLIQWIFGGNPAPSVELQPQGPTLEVIRETVSRPPSVEAPEPPSLLATANPQQFLNELKSIKPMADLRERGRQDIIRELKDLSPRRKKGLK